MKKSQDFFIILVLFILSLTGICIAIRITDLQFSLMAVILTVITLMAVFFLLISIAVLLKGDKK